MARDREAEVIVAGGGAAGLACASLLGRAGIPTILVEARERLGGRVHTVRPATAPLPVELGAEFLHGGAPELMALARDAAITPVPVTDARWRSTPEGIRPIPRYEEQIEDVLDAMDPQRTPDRSFDAFLKAWLADHPDGERAALRAREYVAGFHAADPARAGERGIAAEERGAERHEDAECDYRFTAGYDRVLEHLRLRLGEAVELRLGTAVTAVGWERGRVAVHVRDRGGEAEQTIGARALVVTLPLGVLQQGPGSTGAVAFDPALPRKPEALRGLAMGAARRVVLHLRERIWERPGVQAPDAGGDPAELGFLHATEAAIPIWWTPSPLPEAMLTGWLGGPRAERLTGTSDEQVVLLAHAALAAALGLPRHVVDACIVAGYSHDWGADPWSRGAYSYALVGGAAARRQLAEPVDHTLFWAGEATNHDGLAGSVHGALATGYRAADEVLRALAD